MLQRLPQEMLILLIAAVVVVIIVIVLIIRALLPSGNKATSTSSSTTTVSTETVSGTTETEDSEDSDSDSEASEEEDGTSEEGESTGVSATELLAGLDNYSLITDESEVETLTSTMSSVTPSSCSASSTLVTSSGTTYGTDHLFDDDLTTSWQEGEDDEGIGVTITSTFSSGTDLSAIVFWTGNETTTDKFNNNNRPADITISISSDSQSYSASYTLEDYMGGQAIVFDTAVPVESIVIRIDSVYTGEVYNDTVISELAFLTE